jgi:hypothetical protein
MPYGTIRLPPRSNRGQAAILMTMSIVVILGIMGLVVDAGWAYWRKMLCRTAAQSAAMAAVKAASAPYSSQTSVSCATLSSGPLYVGCQYASANGVTDGSGTQTVKMAAGTTGIPVSGVSGVSYWVSATASEKLPQWFSGILGHTAMAPSVTSVAATLASGGGCVYALATSGTAIYESGGGKLSSGCGVYVNSTADTATTPAINLQPSSSLTATGGSSITIATGGGYVCGAGLNGSCVDGSSMSPMPVHAAAVTDPMAGDMPTAPSVGTCTTQASYTALSPGTYCSISTNGYQDLVLAAGTYVITSGGMQAVSSGQITASGGVTIYLAGGSISASGAAAINLSAPSSGTYNGILIWQPASNTTASSLAGSGSMTLNGIVYMPGAQFNYAGGSKLNGANLTVVANSLYLTGSAAISSPASSPYFSGGGPAGNFLIE